MLYEVITRNPDALSEQIIGLLDNDVERHAMRKKAYTFSRDAVWNEVSRKYLQVFSEVRQNRTCNPRPRHSYVENIKAITNFELPEIKLDHLKAFTDDTGILQHANYTVITSYSIHYTKLYEYFQVNMSLIDN